MGRKMAAHGEKSWPSAGSSGGRPWGGSHGRRQQQRPFVISTHRDVSNSQTVRKVAHQDGHTARRPFLRQLHGRREAFLVADRRWPGAVLGQLSNRIRVQEVPRETVTEKSQPAEVIPLRTRPVSEGRRLRLNDRVRQTRLKPKDGIGGLKALKLLDQADKLLGLPGFAIAFTHSHFIAAAALETQSCRALAGCFPAARPDSWVPSRRDTRDAPSLDWASTDDREPDVLYEERRSSR